MLPHTIDLMHQERNIARLDEGSSAGGSSEGGSNQAQRRTCQSVVWDEF